MSIVLKKVVGVKQPEIAYFHFLIIKIIAFFFCLHRGGVRNFIIRNDSIDFYFIKTEVVFQYIHHIFLICHSVLESKRSSRYNKMQLKYLNLKDRRDYDVILYLLESRIKSRTCIFKTWIAYKKCIA